MTVPNILFLIMALLPSSLLQECQIPLVQNLADSSFYASSELDETTKAANVRITSATPWCPGMDSENENVAIDLACVQPVCAVRGKYSNAYFFSMEHSSDNATWKLVSSEDTSRYDPNLRLFEANHEAVIEQPVRARYFRFNVPYYFGQPCLQVEMYSSPVPEDSFESMGCYLEKSKMSLQAMPDVYHTVTEASTANPDILAIYEKCRQMAEARSPPITVFGIRDFRLCVTTEPGKEDLFSKHGRSKSCAFCRGKAVGSRRFHMFVYKKKN